MEATKAELERAFLLGVRWTQGQLGSYADDVPQRTAARVAERILSERAPAPPAPARRKAAPKETKPAGWSDGAWEHYRAAQRAKSYASLAPDKLAASAMTALDKSEEIRPPLHFSALLYAGRHEATHGFAGRAEGAKYEAPGAALELSKLGVSADLVRWETAEEYARYGLRQEYRSAKFSAHQYPDNISGRPDPLSVEVLSGADRGGAAPICRAA